MLVSKAYNHKEKKLLSRIWLSLTSEDIPETIVSLMLTMTTTHQLQAWKHLALLWGLTTK